jgi:SAM-dependent methyltransferase
VLVPGDRVLDIGCGSGTFALPFARSAARVTGIDPSEVMLSRLQSAAEHAGIDNIRPLRTTWEDYRPEGHYDLVFSAFCPGIYDRQTFAKMEQASARSCCYVAGDVGQFQLLSQLWAVVSGERCSPEAWDIAYPVDYLRKAGRNPRIRRFRHPSLQVASSRDVIDEFASYFRSFGDFRQTEYRKIRCFIDARSNGGRILLGKERTTWVVSWDLPA